MEDSKVKIVYTDAGFDKAITGIIIEETDFFISIQRDDGRIDRIGKRAIIRIKEVNE